MMIDWLSATIRTTHGLSVGYDSGCNLKIGPTGEILRQTKAFLNVREDDDPSSSRNFTVFTPNDSSLYISGNPAKLLQGHNLFGSSDLNGLYVEAGLFVRNAAGLFPSPETYQQFTKPNYSRIDLTRSYRMNSEKEVQEFIRFTAGTARSRHGAATLYGSQTAYLGQNSRRWSMKIYDKHAEFIKNGSSSGKNRFTRGILHRLDDIQSDLHDWSKGILRFELCLRGQELNSINLLLGIGQVPNWLQVFTSYFNKIQFNENTAMTTDNSLLESTLTPQQRAVFVLWRSGADLRTVYSKSAFYRFRRVLIEVLGVDIASPPTQETVETIVKGSLDPAQWDPEPLKSHLVEPRQDIKGKYNLI